MLLQIILYLLASKCHPKKPLSLLSSFFYDNAGKQTDADCWVISSLHILGVIIEIQIRNKGRSSERQFTELLWRDPFCPRPCTFPSRNPSTLAVLGNSSQAFICFFFYFLPWVFENRNNICLFHCLPDLYLGKSRMTQRERLRRKAQLCGPQNEKGTEAKGR